MQQIIITGLKVDTLIGVYDWERTQKTTLLFDVTVEADLTRAMQSDNVDDTIDYAKLAACIQQKAAVQQFELLEALGECIMADVFAQFAVTRIRLAITKPGILPDAEKVTVVFNRSRH